MKEVQEIKKEEIVPEEPKETGADAFFAEIKSGESVNTFISDMQVPKEEIEPPPFQYGDQEEPEEEQKDNEPELSETDQAAFDYTPEHLKTAEFSLVQLDKILAFSFGLISGKDSDRYRRRITKIKGEDYEAELLAALIKKYQMKMSLEAMFISALLISYAPMASKAMQDRTIKQTKAAIKEEPIK